MTAPRVYAMPKLFTSMEEFDRVCDMLRELASLCDVHGSDAPALFQNDPVPHLMTRLIDTLRSAGVDIPDFRMQSGAYDYSNLYDYLEIADPPSQVVRRDEPEQYRGQIHQCLMVLAAAPYPSSSQAAQAIHFLQSAMTVAALWVPAPKRNPPLRNQKATRDRGLLDASDRASVVRASKAGQTQKSLANKYAVSVATINRILKVANARPRGR